MRQSLLIKGGFWDNILRSYFVVTVQGSEVQIRSAKALWRTLADLIMNKELEDHIKII
jgi:hypothetical protein